MNFQSLKSMIDNLIQTYNCTSCNSSVNESNVEVVGTAGSNVNIEIECPQCEKHTIVRAQVYALDIPVTNFSPEQIDELKEKLTKNGKMTPEVLQTLDQSLWSIPENKDAIKDVSIISLNKKLKTKNVSISDMFE